MKKLLVILFLSLIYSVIVHSQERIYFPYFEVMNMHHEYQYSTSKLLKTYIENHRDYEVVLPEMNDSIYPKETLNETQKKAKALGTSYFMTGDINVMGTTAIVSINLHETQTGKKIWQDLLKASSPEDLDPVILRLAKSIGTDIKSSARGDIYSVSEYESNELNKVTAQYNWGIFVGGIYNFYPGLSNNFSAGFGLTFSYDIRNIILDFNTDLFFGDLFHYNFNLTTLLPLKQDPISPFIGAGLGYGGTDKHIKNYDSGGGLIFFARGGYIINRTSNVHMRAATTMFLPFYKIEKQVPAGLMLNLTFLF